MPRSKKASPWRNGIIERSHRTDNEECFSQIGFSSSEERWIRLILNSKPLFPFTAGSCFFHLDPHLGVIISLLFYLSNVLSSVWGAYFIFHDPLKEDVI